MTQKEIAAALRCCSRNFLSGCCDCKMYYEVNCIVKLKTAAADLIENQQREIEALRQAKQDAEIAELAKQTAEAQAETNRVIAESEAAVKIIEAEAEAESNKIVAESITPELIQMKEAEARLKHGWVTVQGADTVVTTK